MDFFTNYFIRLLKLFWIYEFKIIQNHGKICRITYLNAEFFSDGLQEIFKVFLDAHSSENHIVIRIYHTMSQNKHI